MSAGEQIVAWCGIALAVGLFVGAALCRTAAKPYPKPPRTKVEYDAEWTPEALDRLRAALAEDAPYDWEAGR